MPNQPSNLICTVRLLKSPIKSCSLLEEIGTSSKKVFIKFESNIAVGSWKLDNSTSETVKSYMIVKKKAGV